MALESLPGWCIAFYCHVSLVSFNLEYFLSLSLSCMYLIFSGNTASYSVEYPSIWVCLIFSLEIFFKLIFKERGREQETSLWWQNIYWLPPACARDPAALTRTLTRNQTKNPPGFGTTHNQPSHTSQDSYAFLIKSYHSVMLCSPQCIISGYMMLICFITG